MVGEGNIVQILTVIVGVESAKAAVGALQAEDPFLRARNRLAVKGSWRAPRNVFAARSIAKATTAVSSRSG